MPAVERERDERSAVILMKQSWSLRDVVVEPTTKPHSVATSQEEQSVECAVLIPGLLDIIYSHGKDY